MSSKVLRLFVAVYPPAEVASAFASALDALPERDRATATAVPPARLHLTLHFLGDRREEHLRELAESVERAAAGVGEFSLEFDRIATFPLGTAPQTPRLIAAVARASASASELAARLVRRLATKPRSAREVFLPHVTLARFGRAQREGHDPRDTSPGTGPARAFDVGLAPRVFWRVDAIQLVRSVLRSDGADHRSLARIGLKANPDAHPSRFASGGPERSTG